MKGMAPVLLEKLAMNRRTVTHFLMPGGGDHGKWTGGPLPPNPRTGEAWLSGLREDPGRSGQGHNLGLGKFSDEVLNQNGTHQPTPQTQQLGIPPMSGTHTPACGNTGSFTHGARPGIKPASCQTRCQVLTPRNHRRNFSFTSS